MAELEKLLLSTDCKQFSGGTIREAINFAKMGAQKRG